MAELKKIVNFLDKTLEIELFEDESNNGLQVQNTSNIKKIAFAVDGSLEIFEKAKKNDCNMTIVHHGISWKDSLKRITGENYYRIKSLIENNIALYAAHLPLDAHNKYGNNIELTRILSLKKIKKFGKYHGNQIGYIGKFKKEINVTEVVNILEKSLNTKCNLLNFGKEKIKTIGIISGGGYDTLDEAIALGLDCFLLGETLHYTYHKCKEAKINLIEAGHYATETLGVKALMPLIKKKFGVDVMFIDAPTGY